MFKKIIGIALALVVMCTCSLAAFADMDAPFFEQITFTVDSFGGIDAYDHNWDMDDQQSSLIYYCTIPYGTTLTITGESIVNDVEYGNIEYDGQFLYIKMSDVNMGDDVVQPKEEFKVDGKQTVVVINPDGIKLHNGPSFAYSSSLTIPYGTELEYTYSYDTWVYVNYNSTAGWIYSYQYDSAFDCADVKDKTQRIMVVDNETYLLKTPDYKSEKVTDALPIGTILSYKHSYQQPKSAMVYVEYNGTKGWVLTGSSFSDGTAHESTNCIAVLEPEGLKMYSTAKNSNEVVGTVPYNTLISVQFTLWNDYGEEDEPSYYAYVNYNGVKGWLRVGFNSPSAISFQGPSEYKIKADSVAFYSEPNTSSTLIEYIPKGNTVARIAATNLGDYSNPTWALVYNGEYFGWILDSETLEYVKDNAANPMPDHSVTIGKSIPIDAPVTQADETTETTEIQAPEMVDQAKNKKLFGAISPWLLIGFCVTVAFIVAVTAAIIIVIIVKKRKNK